MITKHLSIVSLILLFGIFLHAQEKDGLDRYKMENSSLTHRPDIVFMGNSITEFWSIERPDFFKAKPWVNRGISGQTTPQMLVRFRQDVIELKPRIVVILAGTNDIAG
ncbi:GDSL-type esterase/lipase family protein, partial [Arthrospira platensis SPKY1]|nr:GDSL-type esterase/lipase family protein [Arthrospira platensis SPKY1]